MPKRIEQLTSRKSSCQEEQSGHNAVRQSGNNTQSGVIELDSTKSTTRTNSHLMDHIWLTQQESYGEKFVVERTQNPRIMMDKELTPMERWSRETQMERPWDGFQSFVSLPTGKQDKPNSRDQSGTDDGTWVPCSFSRKERGGKTVEN